MKALIYTTTLILFLAQSVMAKRTAPSDVPPVITDKAIFSVPHFSGEGREKNGGYIEAHHPKTKKFLWRVQIYKTIYKKGLEGDVQDVFIKTLKFDKVHNLLIMSDEKSRVFVLNLTTKKVTQIE